MNHTTLAIVAIVAAAVLATGVFAVSSTQSAYAGGRHYTSNSGGDSSDTSFKFLQKQKNVCSGLAICTNDGIITFGGLPGVPG